MQWIDTRQRVPQLDQEYVVSVTKGNYTFKAVAYFEEGEWFYSVEGKRDERIVDRVNAWVENMGVYVR